MEFKLEWVLIIKLQLSQKWVDKMYIEQMEQQDNQMNKKVNHEVFLQMHLEWRDKHQHLRNFQPNNHKKN